MGICGLIKQYKNPIITDLRYFNCLAVHIRRALARISLKSPPCKRSEKHNMQNARSLVSHIETAFWTTLFLQLLATYGISKGRLNRLPTTKARTNNYFRKNEKTIIRIFSGSALQVYVSYYNLTQNSSRPWCDIYIPHSHLSSKTCLIKPVLRTENQEQKTERLNFA